MLTEVIVRQFALDPAQVQAAVLAGVVTVTGLVERTETALELMARIRHLEGVVGVRNRLAVSETSDWTRIG